MTPQAFKTIMDTVPISHTYYSFPENNAPDLPYFVWYFAGSENFAADNVTYAEILSPIIELYTKTKSFTTESTLETELSKHFFWNKTETFLNSEKMFQIVYEIGDILNG